MLERPTLMIPGPTQVDQEVLDTLAEPVAAHYGADFVAVFEEILRMAQQVFQTASDVYLIPGSGTAALDAGMNALAGEGDRVVVVNNGFFGQRLVDLALAYRTTPTIVDGPWGEGIRPEQVDEAVRRTPGCRGIFVVHSDTSTGALNPVGEIGEVARRHGVPFFVDAISSLGGMDVPVDRWGIDICVTSSQKCLETPPGLGVISISPRAWEVMEGRRSAMCGFYLNLLTWKKYREEWRAWHPYPVTIPTSLYLALRTALVRILAEGLSERFARHARVGAAFRAGAAALGLRPFPAADAIAPTVSVMWMPEGVGSSGLVDYIRRAHGIQIGRGIGPKAEQTLRVGHMGPSAQPDLVERLLAGMADHLGVAAKSRTAGT